MATAEETTGDDKPKELIERLQNYTVVDLDVHEMDFDSGVYAQYMDEPYRSRIEHISKTDEPLTQALVGTTWFSADPAPNTEGGEGLYGLGEDVSPVTPEGIQAFMDRFETDYVVLTGHQLSGIGNVPEPGWAHALMAASNDLTLDRFCDGHEGLKLAIRVAIQAPERAAEEIHRLADEDDVVGVHLNVGGPKLLGAEEQEPIWEAAAEEDLNIIAHPGYTANAWYTMAPQPTDISDAETLVGGPWGVMVSSLVNLIFQGVPERYPDLKFIFQESGIAWIPWVRARMDKNYERRKHALPHLSKKPSEYLQENFFVGTQPVEDAAGINNMRRLFEMIDAENMLVYTSDFPHYDFDYPSVLTIPKFPEETERKIFGANALDILRI
jgi:predicted TIM-barrel fold metal-dependent hydrolase